jgi:hypothetical protein
MTVDKLDEADIRLHDILASLDWLAENGFARDAERVVRERLQEITERKEAA